MGEEKNNSPKNSTTSTAEYSTKKLFITRFFLSVFLAIVITLGDFDVRNITNDLKRVDNREKILYESIFRVLLLSLSLPASYSGKKIKKICHRNDMIRNNYGAGQVSCC